MGYVNIVKVAAKGSKPVYVVVDGDAVCVNGHDPAGLISINEATARTLTVAALKPLTDIADRVFIVRGTEAHAGPHCSSEESIAEKIGAEPDTEAGTVSWWWLPLRVNGALLDIAHHPRVRGFLPWTQQAAASRESAFIASKRAGQGREVPAVAFRGHVHYAADSGTISVPRVLFCPAWQLTTAFGYRIGGCGAVESVGGWILTAENGRVGCELHTWKAEMKREWSEASNAQKMKSKPRSPTRSESTPGRNRKGASRKSR